ncbi:hypothetical protein FRC01_003794 [Tulasnella sp. 417]|nr:hypothetical protein FRC01_003794 [Tulasnella sp. 417]
MSTISQGKERKSFFRRVFGGKTKEEKSSPPLPPTASSNSIFKSRPPPPPPQTASSSPPQPPFTFSGGDAEECTIFIRDIWQFAHRRAKESDERWKAGLAGFCMVGTAKEWYENELDPKTRNDWDLLKVALAQRFRVTRDQSETIPTTPANPPPSIEQLSFTGVYDFSQRRVMEPKFSFDPTIPTPASVITAEPSLPPSLLASSISKLPPTQSPNPPSSHSPPPHAPPSSPTRSIHSMKTFDLGKAVEGYIRIVTWDEQPIYLARSMSDRSCFGPSANSLQASRVVFDPSEDTSGLKLRNPTTHHQWLGIAWSSYKESSQTNAAWIVATTAPTPYCGWLSCTLPNHEGPILPFVWNIYSDASIGVRYHDAQGVYHRLTAVIIEDATAAQSSDPALGLVEDYDKFVSHYSQSHPASSYVFKPAPR